MPLLLTHELMKRVGSDYKGEKEEQQISSGGKYFLSLGSKVKY
jgi:hypothetical protein